MQMGVFFHPYLFTFLGRIAEVFFQADFRTVNLAHLPAEADEYFFVFPFGVVGLVLGKDERFFFFGQPKQLLNGLLR